MVWWWLNKEAKPVTCNSCCCCLLTVVLYVCIWCVNNGKLPKQVNKEMPVWWNDYDRVQPKYWERSLSQCHFVHRKFHIDRPGIEPVSRHYRPTTDNRHGLQHSCHNRLLPVRRQQCPRSVRHVDCYVTVHVTCATLRVCRCTDMMFFICQLTSSWRGWHGHVSAVFSPQR